MKRHASQDTLLKFALDTLEPPAKTRVQAHLDGCSRCQKELADVQETMRTIECVNVEMPVEIPPLPTARPRSTFWMRAAAILFVGFLLGFVAAESRRSPTVAVVQQQILPRSPEIQTAEFISCEEVDLSVNLR
jgi:anti-sigma factor RsiW